ncbi:MAG: NAD-dependent epimerase/dehydratase family protein, partial [Anaerolineaceae bacterium]
YSIDNPDVYMQSNIMGFYNILEACRHHPVEHLIYASSSSVYGSNKKVPFEETDFVDNPVSLYAATKKSNELMAHTYSHLYHIPASGLRFFTVYGPMGRPDMAYYGFTDKYFKGEPIRIFNNGDFDHDLYRDFTYIDDIVEGIVRLIDKPPIATEGQAAHRIYNIGNNTPIKLMEFIHALENALSKSLGKEVIFDKIFEPMKAGDVPATYASTDRLQNTVGFKPKTSIEDGLQKFADWYVDYYKVK